VSERGRNIATWVLVVFACVAIVLALLVGYMRRAAVDSDQFANRATVALKDDSVRSLIAERITDQLVLEKRADLTTARPLIQSVVSSAVGGRAFTGAFRAGVRDLHRTLFSRDQHTLTLAVGDVGAIVAAGLELVQPSVAERVRTTNHVNLVERDIGSVNAKLAQAADNIRLLAWLFLFLALASAAGALLLARDRRRTVVRLGIGTAIGGLLVVVALGVAHRVATRSVSGADARVAVDALWGAFLRDLRTAALILAGIGVVVAAAAASLIRPVAIDAPVRRAGRWLTAEPVRPALKVLRGLVLIAIGLVFLLDREVVLQLAFAAAGLYLVFVGVSSVLALVHQPRELKAAAPPRRGHRGRTVIATAVAGILIVVAIATFVGTGGTSTAAPTPDACNGSLSLCSRSLENVALPATHNSMSAPLPGWFASQQDRPIADQLHDGIRGLLIDTHYADRLPNGKLRTYVSDERQLRFQAQHDGVSPTAVDAALRTRERLGFSGEGTRGIYLCHAFCELGGTTLASVLSDLHDFLVANPGEVVVVINQDYITPADFVSAVQKAGLETLAYRGPTTHGHWLTLRQMIDRNQRVLFLGENHAGAAPWYHPAYKAITKETPFSFSNPRQLTDASQLPASCRPNRGPANAPLFLVNHWITTDPVPLPSNAEKVNAYAPLVRRLRECQRIRHHIPSLVAVDFYRRGDLLRAVDMLNGVEPESAG
jgi:hypothetical protein